jgi:hypothetical protein
MMMMMMSVEQLVERELAGEQKYSEKTYPIVANP